MGTALKRHAALAAAAASLCFAPAAAADTVNLGSIPPAAIDTGAGCSSCSYAQALTSTTSPSYRVPPGTWTVTSWSARGAPSLAPFKMNGDITLQVWRPASGDNFFLVATSSATVNIDDAPTFTTAIPVEPGDLIGAMSSTVANGPRGYYDDGTSAFDYAVTLPGPVTPGMTFTAGLGVPNARINMALTLTGSPPAPVAPGAVATPAATAATAVAAKKCKKPRKLRRGRCVKKKKKK